MSYSKFKIFKLKMRVKKFVYIELHALSVYFFHYYSKLFLILSM